MIVPWEALHQGHQAEVGDLHFLVIPTGPRAYHWSVRVGIKLTDNQPKWRCLMNLEAHGDCRSVKEAKTSAERAGDYIQAAYKGLQGVL